MASTASPSGYYDSVPEGITWAERKALLSEVWRLALPVILTNLLQSLVRRGRRVHGGAARSDRHRRRGHQQRHPHVDAGAAHLRGAGGMSLISQAKGARDPQRMSDVTRQAISSGLLLWPSCWAWPAICWRNRCCAGEQRRRPGGREAGHAISAHHLSGHALPGAATSSSIASCRARATPSRRWC